MAEEIAKSSASSSRFTQSSIEAASHIYEDCCARGLSAEESFAKASGRLIEAESAPEPHKWDRDGEKCIKCGASDWMAGPCKPRPCTCHPDDNPPVPCPRKYALSECRAAASSRESVDEVLSIVGTYGPWGTDINESLRFQIILADEVRRLRAKSSSSVACVSDEQLQDIYATVCAEQGHMAGLRAIVQAVDDGIASHAPPSTDSSPDWALSQKSPPTADPYCEHPDCEHPDCADLGRKAVGRSAGIGYVCEHHGMLAMASKGDYSPLPKSSASVAREEKPHG